MINSDIVEHVCLFLNYQDSLNIYKAFNLIKNRALYKKKYNEIVTILTKELSYYRVFIKLQS